MKSAIVLVAGIGIIVALALAGVLVYTGAGKVGAPGPKPYPSKSRANELVASTVNKKLGANAALATNCAALNAADTDVVKTSIGEYGCLVLVQSSGKQYCALVIARINRAEQVVKWAGKFVTVKTCAGAPGYRG